MTLRLFRVLSTLLAIATLTLSASALAKPWAEVGDRQLREDIEALADAGMIRGPITSWPLPWRQIAALSERWQIDKLPPHLVVRVNRIRRHMDLAQQSTLVSAELGAGTDSKLVRTFEDTNREDAQGSVRVEHNFSENSYVSYGVGYRHGQSGVDYHFDDVYGVHSFGNWGVYVGTVESWWGPGQEGALLLSNSTRPFQRVGIKRMQPYAFDVPVLRWLGPWSFEFFVGRLDGDRTDFEHPLVHSFRFAFKPVSQFEFAVSRTAQLCGSGRPCSFSTFTRSFIAAGTENVSDPQRQPGNQLVSFDARWGGEVGRTMTGTVYAQALAEDGGGPAILPDVYSYLAGGRLSGGTDGWTWSAGIEWTDTYGVRYFGANTPNGRSPGVTYLNFIYRDGYSFKDRPIGFSLDGDSQLYSLSASITDPRNNRLSAALRRANINVTDTPDYHISRNTERLWIGEFGANIPTRWGDIAGELRYQTDQPNTPGRRDGDVQLELRWQGQF